jgi:lipopolysaccharide transport system ATP-binding protein
MNDVAIGIQGLGKRYRLGQNQRATHLREAIVQTLTAPFRRIPSNPQAEDEQTIWALKDVSFEVKRGEVVGVIGRNGAGKSTLLKILSRITEPTEGEAHIYGRVGSLLEVGTGFHPELTGRENVFLNGAILGMKSDEVRRKFDEIVSFSDLERFIDTPVKRYSSGMYVRLAFAVAAHLEPDILIVDEVLAVGDFAFQRKCLGKMGAVANSGHTVLFVSHNTAAVQSLCGRGIVLDQGSVVFDGSQSEAVSRYHRTAADTLVEGIYAPQPGQANRSVPTVRITRASVTGVEEGAVGQLRAGGRVRFRVDCYADECLARPGLGIGIDSLGGQRIVTLHTNYDRALVCPRRVQGAFSFVCTLSLPLVPGGYSAKLSLESAERSIHQVDEAMRFTVLPADDYGSAGRMDRGLILCRQTWSMSTEDALGTPTSGPNVMSK